MTNTRIISIVLGIITLAAIALGVFFAIPTVQASSTDNVYGNAWGASDGNGIGWVVLNNCTSPGNCSGVDFGVKINASGDFFGEGWSSNYGWVDFQGRSPFPCPGGAPHVNLATLVANGSAPVTGFAHIYSAGNGDNYWDGCIGMSGNGWGVTLNSNGSLTGFAWGDEVVGWVQFDATADLAKGCTDPAATNFNVNAIISDPSSCIYPPTTYCINYIGTIDSAQDLINYNTAHGTNLVYDSGTHICADPTDLCPDPQNVQSSSPFYGIQTQADINSWNNNHPGQIIIVNPLSGGGYDYCTFQGGLIPICPTNTSDPNYSDYQANPQDYDANTSYCTIPCTGAACVTIPIFEEI